MKRKIISFLDKLPKGIILCTIVGLLSISSFNIYTLKIETDSINKIVDLVETNSDEEKRNYIKSMFDMGYKLCIQSTDLLSKQLETELISSYDLEVLKKEFDSSILSEDFYQVIKDVLTVKNDTNVLFNTEKLTMVAVKDGIIAEFSNSNKDHILKSENKILTWDKYIHQSSNPELTQSALTNVLNDRNKISFIQKNGENVISTIDINKLIELYMDNGKDILNDYYFLTASFITEDGDIFGTYDQTFLTENNNYKLIVLNTTSIREVFDLFESHVVNIDKRGESILTRVDGYNDLRYISSIVGNVLMFTTALGLVSIYNRKISK